MNKLLAILTVVTYVGLIPETRADPIPLHEEVVSFQTMFADLTVSSIEQTADSSDIKFSDPNFTYQGTYTNSGWDGTLTGTWRGDGILYSASDTYQGTVTLGKAPGMETFTATSSGNAGFLVGDFTDNVTLNQINNATANFVWTLKYSRAILGTETFESDPTLTKEKGGGVLVISGKTKGINNSIPITTGWDFSMKLSEDDQTFTSLNTPVIGLKFPLGFRETGTYTIPTPTGTVGMTISVPEPSTWAMTLLGFAGLALAGYRRARAA